MQQPCCRLSIISGILIAQRLVSSLLLFQLFNTCCSIAEFIKFCITSVSWKITGLYYFSSKFIHFGQKQPIEIKFFEFLSGWEKIHQIFHVILKTINEFFFKFCITLQHHERQLFCTFLTETLYDFYKEPIKVQKI